MNVGQLINQLNKHDEELEVILVSDSAGDFDIDSVGTDGVDKVLIIEGNPV